MRHVLHHLDRIPDSVKAIPTGSYIVTNVLMGIPWDTWASIAAFVYSVLMIGEWCWKKWKGWKAKRDT